jgi:hypothetical protein
VVRSKHSRIQQHAVRLLEEATETFSEGFARILDQAMDDGDLPRSPLLEKKISKGLERMHDKGSYVRGSLSRAVDYLPWVLVGGLMLINLFALYRIARPSRKKTTPAQSGFFILRIRPACTLVISGILLTTLTVGYGDVDWSLLYSFGLIFSALGASMLAGATRGKLRFITPVAWAFAVILDFIPAPDLEVLGGRTAAVLPQGIGLIALPFLTSSLRRMSPSMTRKPTSVNYVFFYLSYGFAVVLIHYGYFVSMLTGKSPELVPGGRWSGMLFIAWLILIGFATLVWALWDLRKASKAIMPSKI